MIRSTMYRTKASSALSVRSSMLSKTIPRSLRPLAPTSLRSDMDNVKASPLLLLWRRLSTATQRNDLPLPGSFGGDDTGGDPRGGSLHQGPPPYRSFDDGHHPVEDAGRISIPRREGSYHQNLQSPTFRPEEKPESPNLGWGNQSHASHGVIQGEFYQAIDRHHRVNGDQGRLMYPNGNGNGLPKGNFESYQNGNRSSTWEISGNQQQHQQQQQQERPAGFAQPYHQRQHLEQQQQERHVGFAQPHPQQQHQQQQQQERHVGFAQAYHPYGYNQTPNGDYRGHCQENLLNHSGVVPDYQTVGSGRPYSPLNQPFQHGTNTYFAHSPQQAHQSINNVAKDNVPGVFYNQQGFVQNRATEVTYGTQQGFIGNETESPSSIQQNFTSFQSGMIHHKQPNGVESNVQQIPTESPETRQANVANPYRGTVEELDAFCKEGKFKEAVDVLDLLEKNGVKLDLPRYFQIMQVCDDPKFIEQAKKLHNHISQTFPNVEVVVHNKILGMYFKCDAIAEAWQLFENMPQRNLTSWDNMIMGLSTSGLGEDALDVYARFKKEGLQPDSDMFVSVFFACGSLGAVDEGMLHFESMKKEFGITPVMAHYVGIVDMLGRCGYLDETLEFIDQMPIEPSCDIWVTLMDLSRLNGNYELGDHCAGIVEQLDSLRLSEEAKNGILPINAHDLAKEKERKKASSLENRSRVHEYKAGDRSHPENDKIYAQLRCLQAQMKESGYVPDTRFVLHDVDQESKEEALLAHSERLALSYGIMTSAARSDIRIIKNLRVCGDCHNALKILSKLLGRVIMARDAKRWHHFKDGACNCNDYW